MLEFNEEADGSRKSFIEVPPKLFSILFLTNLKKWLLNKGCFHIIDNLIRNDKVLLLLK